MSFRARLSLFFVLIVVVPMIALTVLLVQVTDDSKTGKADARLSAGVSTALTIYRDYLDDSRRAARRVAADRALGAALTGGNTGLVGAEAAAAAQRVGVPYLRITDPTGGTLARLVGDGAPIGIARVSVRAQGGAVATVLASAHTAADYAREVKRVTERPAIVLRSGERPVSTVEIGSVELPEGGSSGEVTLPAGVDYRARAVTLGDAAGATRLVLLGPSGGAGLGVGPAILLGLAAFFGLAFAFTFALMRSLGGQHEEVSAQAARDALTGLANRRRFRDLIGKEVERARRFDHPLSLIMLDLDDFKQVNDTYGHPQGDEVLRTIAEVVTTQSREIDEAARYGGEELAVILPETGPAGAHEVAERIRAKIENTPVTRVDGGAPLRVTASIGTASVPETATDTEDLIAAADEALYRAKRAGKNRIEQAPSGVAAQPST